jgi:hypothetical protein
MEQSKIELNKLIATYRGSIIVQRYHAEWHHLMPVVQKIYKFLEDNFLDDFWIKKGIYWQHSKFNQMYIYTPIDIVYKRVVEFITWYNNIILTCNTPTNNEPTKCEDLDINY